MKLVVGNRLNGITSLKQSVINKKRNINVGYIALLDITKIDVNVHDTDVLGSKIVWYWPFTNN